MLLLFKKYKVMMVFIILSLVLHFIMDYLTNKLFFVLPLFMVWLAICNYASTRSGWQELKIKFSINLKEYLRINKKRMFSRIGTIGPITYRGLLRAYCNENGIILRTILPYSFFHKILFISWKNINSMEIKKYNIESDNSVSKLLKFYYNYFYFCDTLKNMLILKVNINENVLIKLPWNSIIEDYIPKNKIEKI